MKKKVKESCKRAGKRSKSGFVWLITREKFIQGGITSLLFGIISALTEGFGIIIARQIPLPIPAKWVMVPILILLLAVFIYADNNIEQWRELIQEKTGEEVDDEEPDE